MMVVNLKVKVFLQSSLTFVISFEKEPVLVQILVSEFYVSNPLKTSIFTKTSSWILRDTFGRTP